MAELARLGGFEHWAFVATRPSGVGEGEYGDAVLSRLPIEEQRVVRFRKWWGRIGRACLLIRVTPPTGANGLPLWFGSAHLQNDVTGYENGAQLRQLAAQLPDEAGASGRVVIGMDANMVGCRLVRLAYEAGLYDGCGAAQGRFARSLVAPVHATHEMRRILGAAHRGTFPSYKPLYRLDGLLAVQPGLRTVSFVVHRKGRGRGSRHRVLGAVGALAIQVTQTDADAAAAASLDQESGGFHASDHLPVCGSVVALR
eukprot:SAG31_NODE_5077_length_2759_cov_2.834211_1_plen_256_part_00